MSTGTATNSGAAERLLAAARQTIGAARYCWAMTAASGGGVNARLMGRLPSLPGEDEWTVWFLTRDRSRKAGEIRLAGRLAVGYQHDADYAVLTGPAALIEDRPELRRRWQDEWKVFFPGGADDASAILVRMEVDRIELCMRGVTPEPFGSRYQALERGPAHRWEVVTG
jgi:general stress protein 26